MCATAATGHRQGPLTVMIQPRNKMGCNTMVPVMILQSINKNLWIPARWVRGVTPDAQLEGIVATRRRFCTGHLVRSLRILQEIHFSFPHSLRLHSLRLLQWVAQNEYKTYLRKFSRSSRLQEDQERSLGFRPFTHSPDMMWDLPAQDEWSSS